MLSYTTRRNLYGDLSNSSASANLTLADTLMNNVEKRILTKQNWPFLEKQYTLTTVASQQDYTLPAYTRKPESVYITVSSQRYTPKEVTTRNQWDELNTTVVTSDSVTHYFVYDGQISFYPKPATASNTITINARRVPRDLSVADYTTGTITTVATSGVVTTVTGSGTTWHTGMIGRYIRITDSGSAANTLTGDHIWYEIATVPSTTTLTLVRAYGGTAIAAASATYAIAQCSLLPEPYSQIPVYEALEIHYTSVDPNVQKATMYKSMGKDLENQMLKDFTSQQNVVIDSGDETDYYPTNANLHVSL